jgi:hypothetical protein
MLSTQLGPVNQSLSDLAGGSRFETRPSRGPQIIVCHQCSMHMYFKGPFEGADDMDDEDDPALQENDDQQEAVSWQS